MSRVRVSENEIQVATGKALRGLGVPGDLDGEAGWMAAVAQTAGLDDGTLLAAGVARVAEMGATLPTGDPAAGGLEAGGQTALVAGLPALEAVLASAASEVGTFSAEIRELGEPALLAGALCRLARLGYVLDIAWDDGAGGRLTYMARPGSLGGALSVAAAGDAERGLAVRSATVTVTSYPGGRGAPPPPARPHASLADWLAHRRAVLTEGVAMPEALWADLKRHGTRILVPLAPGRHADDGSGADKP